MADHESSRPSSEHGASERTVLEVKPAHQAVIVIGLTVVGIALGVVAPFLMQWADGQDWLPFEGPRRLLEKLSSTVGSWILIAIGAVAGVLAGLGIAGELSKISISADEVIIIKGSKKKRFSRAQVTRAMYDDRHLVLRDDRDADLIREDLDVAKDDVLTAFRRHGWPTE
ncbi:YqeB family protein [Microlunatus soli]|uniref:YqeB family protein n=1 Tax=Microlunatus soli TaxID=630515 RepID=UPI000B898679|nr:hypothetical protein [Microlunatus soli]